MHEGFSDSRNVSVGAREWDIPPTIQDGTNNYFLLTALLTPTDEIDDSLEYIYNSQHINTSSGDNLDRIGQFVGVKRESGESDDRYRTRIKANFRAATIEPTADNFVEFVSAILSTHIANFEIRTTDSIPVVNISAEPSVWQDSGLDISTLASILEAGVPAGHTVSIQEQGTLRLKLDGETDDADSGLTSDSISTGGTLSSDVI